MRLLILTTFIVFLFASDLFSQKAYKLSGVITDDETGELIIGAYIVTGSNIIISNEYGFYSVTLPSDDSVTVQFSKTGYESQTLKIFMNEDIRIDLKMETAAVIEEVVVEADKHNKINSTTDFVKIRLKNIKSIPALAGETDLLKIFQLMPGVQSGTEGTSNLYVRGGSPDQNLILLDGVPLYYVNHIGGFVSVFDVNAVKDAKLIKGAFPAQYGGRLSSVFDIRLKDGNLKKMKGNITIGLLNSKLSIETPIKKDTSSLIFSIRRCNIDLITRPISWLDLDLSGKAGYTFWDIYSKFNHKINDKNRIYLSIYAGRDRIFVNGHDSGTDSDNISYKYNYDFNLKWGNLPINFKWNHIVNSNLFSNTSLSYIKFFYKTNTSGIKLNESNSDVMYESSSEFSSGVADFIIKQDFHWFPIKNHTIKFGGAGIYHVFNPGVSVFENSNNLYPDTTQTIKALESYAYIKDEFKMFRIINADIGIHFSSYRLPEKESYFSIQPRIGLNIKLNKNTAVKGAYALMQQNTHLLSSSNVGFPTDLWVPATTMAPPEKSSQISGGILYMFRNLFEVSIEAYYKKMQNLIEFKDGVSFYSGKGNWEEKTEAGGQGTAYGAEMLIRKETGLLIGWISYTISNNQRRFTELNNGKSFPYNYDRKHDLSLVVSYRINKILTLSGTFIYMSGKPITLATNSHASIDPFEYTLSNIVHLYNGKNAYRLPPYHRADVSLSSVKNVKRGIRTLNFSIYNLYNNQNPYFVFFKNNNFDNQTKLYQMSLFPIIPSLSYSLDF